MKKLLLPAALFLAVSITPVAAGAAQDAPEPGSLLPLSIPSHYRVGDGLSFTTQDGRFLVNTGIMTQIAYTVYDYGDNDETRRETRVTEELGLRRLYWWFKGHAFRPELTYFMQVDFADDDGVRLLDGYVNYRFLKEVQVRGGRYIVPFSRQGNVSVGNLQFTDRSSATVAFSPDRDDGFSLEGNFLDGIVRYSAGVFSGAGPGGRRRIHARAYNARIEASNRRPGMPYSEADVENTRPPLVAVGAAIYRNRLRKGVDERGRPVLESVRQPYAGTEGWVGRTFRLAGYDVVDEIDITQWQADAAFMWRGLFLQSEYFAGKAEGRRSGASVEGKGIYVQGGYFVIPDRLEFAYRYSFVDPSREFRDDMTDHQGVVNWYFVDHNLKLQAEYTRRDVEYPPPLQTEKANIYRVQFQMKF